MRRPNVSTRLLFPQSLSSFAPLGAGILSYGMDLLALWRPFTGPPILSALYRSGSPHPHPSLVSGRQTPTGPNEESSIEKSLMEDFTCCKEVMSYIPIKEVQCVVHAHKKVTSYLLANVYIVLYTFARR